MTRNVFMDFTADREITFGVTGEIFRVFPDVPLQVLDTIGWSGQVREEELSRKEMYSKMIEAICLCLYTESADRFRRCIEERGATFMGINGIMQLQTWLMEVLSDRPTQESEDSSPTSDETGESSTDGHSVKELIS
jgi:hypothetical protein